MRIFTLWHEGADGEVPWIVSAVDQHSVEDCEFPPSYLKQRADIHVREMIIDIPMDAVRTLFSAPRVKGTVIQEDPKAEQQAVHTPSDTPAALLLTARNFGSGYARESDVAAAAYRLAAAKLRAWGNEAPAKGLESAAEQAERGLASEWTERTP